MTRSPSLQRFGLLLLLTSSMLADCQVAKSPETAAIEEYLQENYPDFSGAILVARGNAVLLSQGFGMADYEEQIPN
ncbi:MAG: hypothetical protein V2A34_03595, partial [Lentisphaerota bacterium]